MAAFINNGEDEQAGQAQPKVFNVQVDFKYSYREK